MSLTLIVFFYLSRSISFLGTGKSCASCELQMRSFHGAACSEVMKEKYLGMRSIHILGILEMEKLFVYFGPDYS
jgi:hypothetical protein